MNMNTDPRIELDKIVQSNACAIEIRKNAEKSVDIIWGAV